MPSTVLYTLSLHDALPISVFQDLEEGVEDVRMGLLDLVEEDHGEGPAADCLGELAALVVADIAGRGADETADRVLLHVFGDRKSTRLNSSHVAISYAVFCL